MTDEDAHPFLREIKALGPVALDDLFKYAQGSDRASCRSVAVEVAGHFATEDSTLIPRLVKHFVPLFRDRDLRGYVASVFVGLGKVVTPHMIHVLESENSDERTMSFSVLFTVHRERVVDRKDLQEFEPQASNHERATFAKRWEEWWRMASGD